MASKDAPPRIMNVNVGILGHVDSGKTSLARALSTLLSTAALDKHPQSMERGITLDLGFSAFLVDLPPHLQHLPYDQLQFTLVDCPGHASLIRTILGGAQIIDIMLLVVDVVKGVQTQTAECMVVGEITPTQDVLVVLNKIDQLPLPTRAAAVEKMTRRLRATFRGTKFADAPIVPVAASPPGAAGGSGGNAEGGSGGAGAGGGGGGGDGAAEARGPLNMGELVRELTARVRDLRRSPSGPFLFSVDHCFQMRGQGTVLTGTVLAGSVAVGQALELPDLKLQKKVKSMQMFHRPVQRAMQGDRVGICVTQLDAGLLERGLAAEPGSVPTIGGALVAVHRIRFFKGRIASKAKFHVTVGHSTVLASVLFFSCQANDAAPGGGADPNSVPSFDSSRDYQYEEELPAEETSGRADSGQEAGSGGTKETEAAASASGRVFWVLLSFESPVTCPNGALLIGSRLDTGIHSNSCRLAFYGRLSSAIDPHDKVALQSVRVFRVKRREGSVERWVDAQTAVGRGLFKKETDMSSFLGLRVTTPFGETGVIQSSFGKSGKYKVAFASPMDTSQRGQTPLALEFRRFIHDPLKKMVQST